jgi:hypothetical protein
MPVERDRDRSRSALARAIDHGAQHSPVAQVNPVEEPDRRHPGPVRHRERREVAIDVHRREAYPRRCSRSTLVTPSLVIGDRRDECRDDDRAA